MSHNTVKLFLYGTLMRGGMLHDIIRGFDGEFIGSHLTLPIYDIVEMEGFPALYSPKVDNTTYHIAGEVWELPEYALDYIDRVEVGYNRIKALLTKSTKINYNESAYLYKFAYNPFEFIIYPPKHIITISILSITKNSIRIWVNGKN